MNLLTRLYCYYYVNDFHINILYKSTAIGIMLAFDIFWFDSFDDAFDLFSQALSVLNFFLMFIFAIGMYNRYLNENNMVSSFFYFKFSFCLI